MQILLETKCNCRRIVEVNDKKIDMYTRYKVPLYSKVQPEASDPKNMPEVRDFLFTGRYDLSTGLPVFEEE